MSTVEWPADELGQALTLRQELAIRLGIRRRRSYTDIAREVRLPVDLVRLVAEFAARLETKNCTEGTLLWYGERTAEPGERCPRCRGRLTVWPCRGCRMREYRQETDCAG